MIEVKKVEMLKIKENIMVYITLYNKGIEECFFHKRFIPGTYNNALWGFKIKQFGKEIKYKGKRIKLVPKFPDDYISIKPNENIILNSKINNFFNFNQSEEVLVSYYMSFKCPLSADKTQRVVFEKALIAH